MQNNILAIIDGAYWDHQIPLNNHIAVLNYLPYIIGLNNKYTLFTGMGNQWPPFEKANALLEEKLKEYKKEHPDNKVVELRTAEEGEKLEIDMNKLLPLTDELLMKPPLHDVISNPMILRRYNKRVVAMLHLRCHQLWGIKKDDMILKAHVVIVKEFFRRGMHHHIVNDLDTETYRILGISIKAFKIWEELENEIVIKSDIVKFVGSYLNEGNPNDLDVIAPMYLEKLLTKFFNKYNPHFIGDVVSHGEVINVYDLILRKHEYIMKQSSNLPNYNESYNVCKRITKLDMRYDTYIVEPLIEGKSEVITDHEARIIYEHIITSEGKEVITDMLAYKGDNFSSDILINRLFFMHKKWLDNTEPKLLPVRWIVPKVNLIKFLSSIGDTYSKVIIRPASSFYEDGKFILTLNKSLQPFNKFPPLKATGSAYHALEYFTPEDAWTFFGKYGVEKEGKVRFEYKIDGWRSIWQAKENKDAIVYFEDSRKDVSRKLPNVINELNTLHESGIILDGELMEDLGNNKWNARQNLMRWAQSEHPGTDENIRVIIYDILYYNGVDLHDKPFSERHSILVEVSKKFKKHFVLCPGFDITTEHELSAKFNFLKTNPGEFGLDGRNGIDGLMGKLFSSNYPLNGKTMGWVKLKYNYEMDTIILKRNQAGSAYNYTVGYGIPQNQKDKFTPTEDLNGVTYGVLGTTFNTNIKGEVGQILNIAALEYKKETIGDKVKYTLFQARVLTLKPDKKEPDTYLIADKLSVSKAISFYEYFIETAAQPLTGQWTIEEGMSGKYAIQCHTRGINPILLKYLSKDDLKTYGLNPSHFVPSDSEISTLNSIVSGDWKGAIDIASKEKESSQKLETLVKQALQNFDKLPDSTKHLLALVDPVSIHQDIRLVPDKADYFEGGHWTTPGNQFKENKLLKVNDHIYLQFMLKEPHVSEATGAKEPVIRGPASWLTVGEGTPLLVPPNSIGSTVNDYASFWIHEKGNWYAGRQKSPHGSHFKLFKFEGTLLQGWYIFMWAPIGKQRIWLFYKPINQDKYKDESTRDKQFDIDIEKFYQSVYKVLYIK